MKLEDCRKLKKGDKVMWSLGNGWYQTGEFIKLRKVTTFPKMTIDDLLNGNFSLDKGKDEWMAEVEYINDKGQRKSWDVRPRRLSKV